MESRHNLHKQTRHPPLNQPILKGSANTNSRKKGTKTGFVRNNLAIRNRFTAYRSYGFLRANNTGTPYPRRADPLDSDMLSARLAVASQLGSFLGAESLKSSQSDEDIQIDKPVATKRSVTKLLNGNKPKATWLSFAERRKLFDLAEFTICKGHKLSDTFHQREHGPDTMHNATYGTGSLRNHSSFTSGKSQSLRNYKEMEAFCLARNFQLNRGFEFSLTKKL